MAELKSDSATNIRPGEELDLAALNSYLNDTVPGFGRIIESGQFPGGYSNLTYLLKTDSSTQEYVLRRPPFGTNIKGGHDMGREFRVLSLLQSADYQKIPEPVVFCDDESVMRCPFYIMKRVSGIILRAHTAPKLNLSLEIMRRASESLVDNLVQLHALDIHKTGLIQLGKPQGYVRRQVEGWHRRT
jgi:aminoglycoside phosphotransferase (APT) family kinase protein